MEIFKSNKSKVEEWVEKALGASQTYGEALVYIDAATHWNVESSLLRDAVREEIEKKALDSQIRLNSEQVDKVKKNVLGDLSVRVDAGNMEEVKKLIDELVVKLKEANELIDELASKKNIKISLETSFD